MALHSTLKCNHSRSLRVEKDFIGCFEIQRCSRSMIQLIHGLVNFCFGHSGEIPAFGKILSEKTVRIFIQSTFPGSIRMRAVNLGIKILGHARMSGKFTAIIIGDRLYPGLVRSKPLADSLANQLSRLAAHVLNHGEQRFSLNECDQRLTMPLANDRITFPVSKSLFGLHNGGPIVNQHLIGDKATSTMCAIAFAPLLLAAQKTVQVTP